MPKGTEAGLYNLACTSVEIVWVHIEVSPKLAPGYGVEAGAVNCTSRYKPGKYEGIIDKLITVVSSILHCRDISFSPRASLSNTSKRIES
jgi:hypothetical protein